MDDETDLPPPDSQFRRRLTQQLADGVLDFQYLIKADIPLQSALSFKTSLDDSPTVRDGMLVLAYLRFAKLVRMTVGENIDDLADLHDEQAKDLDLRAFRLDHTFGSIYR